MASKKITVKVTQNQWGNYRVSVTGQDSIQRGSEIETKLAAIEALDANPGAVYSDKSYIPLADLDTLRAEMAAEHFPRWERAVLNAIIEQAECSNSDAQAIMEAQDKLIAFQYAANTDPATAATAILKAGASQ